MGYITDADYAKAKRVHKDFRIKNWMNTMICIFKVINYCQLIYFTFGIGVLKYMDLIFLIFFLFKITIANGCIKDKSKIRSFD